LGPERKAVMLPDATVTAVGLRVVKLLVGNPPQSIDELALATGVTRTAVIEQLRMLVKAGLAERHTQRLGSRGRPRYLFSATTAALLMLFASNQNMVVPAIWEAIGTLGGAQLRKKVLRRVSQTLAAHYAAKISATTPRERLQQFTELLRDEGGLLELRSHNGQIAMYKRSCPFISMFEEERHICCVDLDMISNVVGAPVRLIACRHDGAACCVFEVDKAKE